MMLRRLAVPAAVALGVVAAWQLALRRSAPPAEPLPSVDTPHERLPVVDSPAPALPPAPLSNEPERGGQLEAVASDESELELGDATAREGILRDGSSRFVFRCVDGSAFTVRAVASQAIVSSPTILGDEVLTLPQTEAASGVARYEQGDALLRIEGNAATFAAHGRAYVDCSSATLAAVQAAISRSGVVFRAMGNEPPWLLEVSLAQIDLATDGGARRSAFPYRGPTTTGRRTVYHTFVGTQELRVVADSGSCNDTMSGELFPFTVTVAFDGTMLYGCGSHGWSRRPRR